ncbi:MAG: hypothetical protein QOJ20_1736 [Mycobacterium sp.]|jgi:hypothetical protein|nr:hypothetical protein [Mycobacterium sp.]
MTQPGAEAGSPDPKFALAWYPRWLEAWNSHEPDRLKELVTDDFVLQTPTTRMTGMVARGPQGVSDYMRFVVTAYPDLIWEMIAPPMFSGRATNCLYLAREWTFHRRTGAGGYPGNRKGFLIRRAGDILLSRREGLRPQCRLRPRDAQQTDWRPKGSEGRDVAAVPATLRRLASRAVSSASQRIRSTWYWRTPPRVSPTPTNCILSL